MPNQNAYAPITAPRGVNYNSLATGKRTESTTKQRVGTNNNQNKKYSQNSSLNNGL